MLGKPKWLSQIKHQLGSEWFIKPLTGVHSSITYNRLEGKPPQKTHSACSPKCEEDSKCYLYGAAKESTLAGSLNSILTLEIDAAVSWSW